MWLFITSFSEDMFDRATAVSCRLTQSLVTGAWNVGFPLPLFTVTRVASRFFGFRMYTIGHICRCVSQEGREVVVFIFEYYWTWQCI